MSRSSPKALPARPLGDGPARPSTRGSVLYAASVIERAREQLAQARAQLDLRDQAA